MTMAIIVEADGRDYDKEVEWSTGGIRAEIGGDFKIVGSWKGYHIIEAADWHSRGINYNPVASEKFGMALHGKILLIKEPTCTSVVLHSAEVK